MHIIDFLRQLPNLVQSAHWYGVKDQAGEKNCSAPLLSASVICFTGSFSTDQDYAVQPVACIPVSGLPASFPVLQH